MKKAEPARCAFSVSRFRFSLSRRKGLSSVYDDAAITADKAVNIRR